MNTAAPVHGGDIALTFHEKALYSQVDLLGNTAGASSGAGIATDADGDYLTVTDVVVSTSGDRVDDIAGLGIEIQGNKLGVRPLDIAPNLDMDETYTVEVNFNISDGVNKTPRMATLTFTGEDFAPVITGDLVSNLTREAPITSLDLLTNVVDADGEALTISNLTADSGNTFELPVTLTETSLDIDVPSISAQIPDGQKVTFNFTYTISDHRFDLVRNLQVNVLGVKDVAGAPLIGEYFPGDEFDETDGLKTYDLIAIADAVDREGDDITVSNVMVNGSADLPYGVSLEGNTLSFNPNAFYDDIAAGGFEMYSVTYNISDVNGNTSDGNPQLDLKVNGVESNVFKAFGADTGFENDGAGFTLFNCPAGTEMTDTIVANGTKSMQMLGAPCYVNIGAQYFPDMAKDQKYYLTYNVNVGSGDAAPYIMISNDPNGSHNFWQGARPYHPANDTWRPMLINYDTNAGYLGTANGDGEKPTDIGDQLQLFVMSAWMGNDGMPVFDDFSIVRYDTLEGVDILTGNPGSFEDMDYVPVSSGGGTVEVQTDPNNADNKVLYVDTTGADAGGVKIDFAIPNGALVSGGKYRVSYDVQYVNFDANKEAGTDPNINQWGGYRFEVVFSNPDTSLEFTLFSDIWNGAAFGRVEGIADETSHWWGFGTDTNWDSDNITASFVLKGVGAQYIIDNIKIDRVP